MMSCKVLSFVSVYLYDILIFSKTPEEHVKHVSTSSGQNNVKSSFDTLRSALIDVPAIMIPDFNMQFAVLTNAYD